MHDPLTIIQNDLEKPRDTAGMLKIATVNETMLLGKMEPDPVDLYHKIIYEGEIVCIFADTGAGKSILATQIGEHISKTQPVLYVDCELSRKQFQLRYSGENGCLHVFPELFYRAELCPESICARDFEEKILKNIELAANKVRAKVIIIDNLTYLCNASEKGENASIFMKNLKDLQHNGFTILVIAHTPKRSMYSPLTDCDLAGSRRLANFFDSISAIGRSAKDPSLRYIKQVKASRIAPDHYSADNVIVCQIVKDETNAIRLEKIGYALERDHLRVPTEEELADLETNVNSLKGLGLSFREIAKELGISKSKVGRIINKGKGEIDDE